MLVKDTIIASKTGKFILVVLGVATAVLLSAAAASAGRSENIPDENSGQGQAPNAASLENKVETTSPQVSSEVNLNSSSRSDSSDVNTKVQVNGQDIKVKKNSVTRKTIKSENGNTSIEVENQTTANGSATNTSVNHNNINTNSSSSVQSYSSNWSSQ